MDLCLSVRPLKRSNLLQLKTKMFLDGPSVTRCRLKGCFRRMCARIGLLSALRTEELVFLLLHFCLSLIGIAQKVVDKSSRHFWDS